MDDMSDTAPSACQETDFETLGGLELASIKEMGGRCLLDAVSSV